jgi:hypothetical protein
MMSEDTSSDQETMAATQSKPELLVEAGAALKSLLWQWVLCFGIWVAMLLITRGSPSPTEIGICCVISFLVVAFDESKNVFRNERNINSSSFPPSLTRSNVGTIPRVPLFPQIFLRFLKLFSFVSKK